MKRTDRQTRKTLNEKSERKKLYLTIKQDPIKNA